ncbi:MAG: hypothetical protein C0502_02355 [Opitutus sp.]|nr:hypothetical protein [Opitutus sp.]
MTEHRPLLMRANRLLGSALVEHNLVKFEDLEVANERVLELAGQGNYRQASVLGILAFEKKALREEDVLRTVMEEQGLGVVDLRHYDVPEEIRRELDLGMCWATWTVPYDTEEEFWFLATAYYLSPAVRAHWEKKFEGHPIIWHATTMEIIAEFLDRQQAERDFAATGQPVPRTGTRAPFSRASKPPFPPAPAT